MMPLQVAIPAAGAVDARLLTTPVPSTNPAPAGDPGSFSERDARVALAVLASLGTAANIDGGLTATQMGGLLASHIGQSSASGQRRRLAHAGEHGTPRGTAGASTAPGAPKQATMAKSASPAAAETDAKSTSDRLGEAASLSFLLRGLLTFGKGPGFPSLTSAYLTISNLDRRIGNKLLPEFIRTGPAKDLIDLGVLASILVPSVTVLPETGRVWAAQARAIAPHQGKPTLGSWLKASVMKIPEEAAHGGAHSHPGAPTKFNVNFPGAESLYKLIKPLMYVGFTLSAASSIVGLAERLKEHGTDGLLATRSGRGALFGAISGVALLPSIYMPVSPMQRGFDVFANVAWLVDLVNGKGWLDPILGADPAEKRTAGKRASSARSDAGKSVTRSR